MNFLCMTLFQMFVNGMEMIYIMVGLTIGECVFFLCESLNRRKRFLFRKHWKNERLLHLRIRPIIEKSNLTPFENHNNSVLVA